MPEKRQDQTARTMSASLVRERGEIQRGETGDKIAGIDPAAAPLETDSEAGSAASYSAGAASRPPAPAQPAGSRPNASSHADAMRQPVALQSESRWIGPAVALAIVVVVGALLLVIM